MFIILPDVPDMSGRAGYAGSMAVTACLHRRRRSNGIRPSAVIAAITHQARRNAAICASAELG